MPRSRLLRAERTRFRQTQAISGHAERRALGALEAATGRARPVLPRTVSFDGKPVRSRRTQAISARTYCFAEELRRSGRAGWPGGAGARSGRRGPRLGGGGHGRAGRGRRRVAAPTRAIPGGGKLPRAEPGHAERNSADPLRSESDRTQPRSAGQIRSGLRPTPPPTPPPTPTSSPAATHPRWAQR